MQKHSMCGLVGKVKETILKLRRAFYSGLPMSLYSTVTQYLCYSAPLTPLTLGLRCYPEHSDAHQTLKTVQVKQVTLHFGLKKRPVINDTDIKSLRAKLGLL